MNLSVPSKQLYVDVPTEGLSAVFTRIGGMPLIEFYFVSTDKATLGKFTLSPFEIRKLLHEADRLLKDNKIPA